MYAISHYIVSAERKDDSSEPYRCGYVALAGQPNVGKSTLLNALVGTHLSIVTPKAQTTRERIAGLVTTDAYQILFIDAPGLIEPRYALQEAMRLAAAAALEEADVITYVVDATRPGTFPDKEIVNVLTSFAVPGLVAINKSDLVESTEQANLMRQAEVSGFPTHAISAVNGSGLNRLVRTLVPLLPESPPLFPADETATQPVRFFAQEFVRETCMELLREEVPYAITCQVDEFREDRDPIYVSVVIYVERESQKGIVIGKGGSSIKQIGRLSRLKIEDLIGGKVYLELRVKVLQDWRRKRARLERLGFRLPPSNADDGQRAR